MKDEDLASKIDLSPSPPMASVAVCSKAVVLLLFIHCLLMLRWSITLFCSTLCPFLFCNHLAGEERVGCFTFVVF